MIEYIKVFLYLAIVAAIAYIVYRGKKIIADAKNVVSPYLPYIDPSDTRNVVYRAAGAMTDNGLGSTAYDWFHSPTPADTPTYTQPYGIFDFPKQPETDGQYYDRMKAKEAEAGVFSF